jgi:hypothetical protein
VVDTGSSRIAKKQNSLKAPAEFDKNVRESNQNQIWMSDTCTLIRGKGHLFPSLQFHSSIISRGARPLGDTSRMVRYRWRCADVRTADYRSHRARDTVALTRPEIGVFGTSAEHPAGWRDCN